MPKGELLLVDAPELIERFLGQEQDLSAKRNALHMLTTHAPARAVTYLFNHLENLPLWGDILQMAVLELIRKVGFFFVEGAVLKEQRLDGGPKGLPPSCL